MSDPAAHRYVVHIGIEYGRVEVLGDHYMICIEQQQVVGRPPCKRHRLTAVRRKIPPRTAVQHTGQMPEFVVDDVGCGVSRTGVNDGPPTKEMRHAVETPPNHRSLVLHDHHESETWAQPGGGAGEHDGWHLRFHPANAGGVAAFRQVDQRGAAQCGGEDLQR